jgi:hypothetical protein
MHNISADPISQNSVAWSPPFFAKLLQLKERILRSNANPITTRMEHPITRTNYPLSVAQKHGGCAR